MYGELAPYRWGPLLVLGPRLFCLFGKPTPGDLNKCCPNPVRKKSRIKYKCCWAEATAWLWLWWQSGDPVRPNPCEPAALKALNVQTHLWPPRVCCFCLRLWHPLLPQGCTQISRYIPADTKAHHKEMLCSPAAQQEGLHRDTGDNDIVHSLREKHGGEKKDLITLSFQYFQGLSSDQTNNSWRQRNLTLTKGTLFLSSCTDRFVFVTVQKSQIKPSCS